MKKLRQLKDKISNNKPLKITYGLIKGVFTIVVVLLLAIVIAQKFNLSIAGIKMYNVLTGSMEPVYHVGDIIIDRSVPESELKVGDDVTYLGTSSSFEGMVITHRIVRITEEEGVKTFVTKGTANDIEDTPITYNQIYGKVIYKTYVLSAINKVLNNIYAYFAIFTIVGIAVSLQIVSIVFDSDNEDEDDESTNKKKD